jgi:hypothetical protein
LIVQDKNKSNSSFLVDKIIRLGEGEQIIKEAQAQELPKYERSWTETAISCRTN